MIINVTDTNKDFEVRKRLQKVIARDANAALLMEETPKEESIFDSLARWREERNLEGVLGDILNNIKKEIDEYRAAENEEDEIDALCDIIVFSVNGLEALGYDAEKSMRETLREIHSRDGEYCPFTVKWEKYTDEESVKNWYEADYEGCKRA